MDYILNELSIGQVENIHEARSLLEDFVKTCIKAKNDLSLDVLRIPESIGSLFNLQLTTDYPLSKWLHDHEVNYDIRQKLYQIIAYPPLLKKEDIEELDIFNSSCFYYDSSESMGLGVAFLFQSLAVSFLLGSRWDTDHVFINHQYFDEEVNVISSTERVLHSSKESHIATHLPHFNDLRRSYISKCSDIWDHREELFPNLIFCGKTNKQLKKGISSRYVHQIYDRLSALNKYINSWKTGEFDLSDFVKNYNIDCSNESDCTLNLYGDQRRFSIPGKGSVLFSLHIKTGDLRLHFYPEAATRKVFIGYIGNHLDTCTG
jgi:hypothetical protein